MRGFSFYEQLSSLSLYGEIYYGTRVTIDSAMFPIHLTSLGLADCRIRQDLMAVLEKLYHLKSLSVANGIDGRIKTIKCSTSGFPHLQTLDFVRAEELKKWVIEEVAMPMLQELTIRYCPVLSVPLGLQSLNTLRRLTWNLKKGRSAAAKAEEIRSLCTHVPHIDFEED